MIFSGCVMPALFTRMSTLPRRAITSAAARSQSSLLVTLQASADVRRADVGRRLRGRFRVQVEDRDARSVLGEQPGGGFADSACRGGSGDDRDLVLQQHGVSLVV